MLLTSRALLSKHPTPALVFATIAIEVGLKVILLKPIVYGLVHDTSAAGLITDLAIGHGVDRCDRAPFATARFGPTYALPWLELHLHM